MKMNNTIESLANDLNNTYPVFEPNQLLTNTHLNQLRTYLDVQDRLSRVKLVGMGIVCGLEVSYKNNTISISGGTGVTSQGFLIDLPNGDFDKCVKANYIDPENYVPFMKSSPGSTEQIEMHELFPKGVKVPVGVETIDFGSADYPNFLKDKVVVLFVEYDNVDLESCLGQNCDDKGIARKFTVRKLLLNCDDVDKIIRDGYEKFPFENADDKDETLNGSLNLRFNQDYMAIAPATLISHNVSYENYLEAYQKLKKPQLLEDRFLAVFKDAKVNPMDGLAQKIEDAYRRFNPLLGDLSNKEVLKKLKERFKKFLDESIENHTIQYYYDYAKDLVMAYNEFFDGAFELTAECCPNKLAFKQHLVLGKVTLGLGCPENEDLCKPKVYRTHFIQSPIYNQQKAKLAQVRNNFNRLLQMIDGYQSSPPEKAPLKITPSDEKQHPLALRSIPFYYKPKPLWKYWNYNLSKKCRIEWNLGYHLGGYEIKNDESTVYPPAFCSDQHNFYRIEGLLEKSYSEIVKELEILKRKFQLEFDVMALKLQKDGGPLSQQSNCGITDIKEDYLQLRNEIIAETKKYTWLISKFFYFITNSREIMGDILGDGTDGKDDTNDDTGKPGAASGYTTGYQKTSPIDAFKDIMQSIDEVEDLIKAMPICIEQFKMDEFQDAYKELQELSFIIAVAFENVLRGFSKGTTLVSILMAPMIQSFIERFFLVNYGFIGSIYDLNDILRSNWDVKMKSIIFSYRERLDALDNAKLFCNFAKNNPGLEHMAGVPKGGTFIMVYGSEKNPKVVADFALSGKPCCKEPFPMCNTNAPKYPPVAKNVYFFIDSNLDQGVPVYIDVLEFAVDLNEPTEVLDIVEFPERTAKEKRVQKNKVKRVESTVLGRAVVEYQTTHHFDLGIDKFEFTVINKRGEKDTACVFVAKVNLGVNIFLNIAKSADDYINARIKEHEKSKETEVLVAVDGEELDLTLGETKIDRGVELARVYETQIKGDDNRAKIYIDRTKENNKKLKDLGGLETGSTPDEVKAYEKKIIADHGRLMKETKKEIQALDVTIGEIPASPKAAIEHRLLYEEQINERDALVVLYEDQNQSLLKVISEQDLAKDTDSELYKFVDTEVRSYNNVVSKHTKRTNTGFEAYAAKDGLNVNAKGLLSSFND